jgi:hypothetical protein
MQAFEFGIISTLTQRKPMKVTFIEQSTAHPRPQPKATSTDYNVTDENDLHRANHSSVKTAFDEGIAISTNPVPMNVHLSIRDNLDVDLKIRDETTVHS